MVFNSLNELCMLPKRTVIAVCLEKWVADKSTHSDYYQRTIVDDYGCPSRTLEYKLIDCYVSVTDTAY